MIATAAALYLYLLLPATAVVFYELYHLVPFEPIYWGYGLFKAAGYYFGLWEYRLQACLLLFLSILFVPPLLRQLRGSASPES